MFTGIIEKTGIIENLARAENTHTLTVRVGGGLDSVKIGDSVAVNGACLTIVKAEKDCFTFDITDQTFKKTSLVRGRKRDVVNIERSIKAGSRMEGHFVLGHVDSVRNVTAIKKYGRSYIEIDIFPDDKTLVVEKGSIAIDGISLTVAELRGNRIRAYLIPHTLRNTNLMYKKKGDAVNLEFDILGKYVKVKEVNEKHKAPIITRGFLAGKGFI